VSGINENSLKIYRNENDGHGWHALNNCTVNTSAKNVTCSTNNFSVFALFGEEGTTQTATTGGAVPVWFIEQMQKNARAAAIASTSLSSKSIVTSPTEKKFVFVRWLNLGMSGDDVKQLQILLNKKGFIISKTSEGSPGKETIYFGKATRNALIKFQQANGLKPYPGYLGPATLNLLNKFISG